MQGGTRGSQTVVLQRSLPQRRFALLYGAIILLVLILVLLAIRLPLGIQPAALVGFPVALLATVTLIFVLLVLVAPSVPATRAEALQESVSLICDPALALDPKDGRILAMNEPAVALLGDPAVLVGSSLDVIFPSEPERDLRGKLADVCTTCWQRLGQYAVILGSGSTRRLPIQGRVVYAFNRPSVVIVLRAAEADQALAAFARVQERLMSNISHELRTPLNVVMGFSELMTSGTLGPLSEKQLDAAREIHEGGVRMLHVVDDVLDIGRARNYGLELEPGPVDIAKLAVRVRDLVAGTARREHVKLEFSSAADLPTVYADERTFKQLLYHLVIGAIDRARPEGQVKVSVTAADEQVKVEVSSSGRALDAEELQAMVAPPEEMPVGADGLPLALGMPLCAALAARLGTRLQTNGEGEGAVVWFALQRAQGALP